jgi:hypothetical protein
VASAKPRREHTARRDPHESQDPEIGIEERHRDLETHAERVDRARPLEEQPCTGLQPVSAE